MHENFIKVVKPKSEEAELLARIDDLCTDSSTIIPWSIPVPSFGDVSAARVATVGINPSNKEFVDEFDRELDGTKRRFPTLTSLGLREWSDADFVLALGDDRTDEDMFARLPSPAWTVRVGPGDTKAAYFVPNLPAVRDLLGRLAGLR